MKRKDVFILVIGFATLFYSCQKSVRVDNQELSAHLVNLWAGTDTTVSLSALKIEGNTFTISNDNKDVARVTTNNDNIIIQSYKPGRVNVTLKNERNKAFKFRIEPFDIRGYVFGYWISISNESRKSYVTVTSSDQQFSDSLHNALLAEIDDKGRSGNMEYHFLNYNESPIYKYVNRPISFSKEGIWVYDKLQLTLNYDNKKEIYQIIPLSPNPTSFIELKRDLTNEMQTLFPNKKVTEVTTHQFFIFYRMPG